MKKKSSLILLAMFSLIMLLSKPLLAYAPAAADMNDSQVDSQVLSYNYYICMAEMSSNNNGSVAGICKMLYGHVQTRLSNEEVAQSLDCYFESVDNGSVEEAAVVNCTNELL